MKLGTIMKIGGAMGLALLVASSGAWAEETVLLRCQSPARGNTETSVYEVWNESGKHTLVRILNGKEVGRVTIANHESVVGYGGTYLFFENLGRSGYLLIYVHQVSPGDGVDKSMIDVNLFQEAMRPMNSEGPHTDFICKAH